MIQFPMFYSKYSSTTYYQGATQRTRGLWNEDGNANVGRPEKYFFIILFFYYKEYLYFGYLVCLFSLKNRWIQRLLLHETMDVSYWNVGQVRQRGNGAVEVSFESRTAQMSALFHIFTCDFCLLQLVLLLYRRCRRHPRLFCLRSLICEEDIGRMASTTRMHFAAISVM